MIIHTISSANRERVNEFIVSQWFSTVMVVRGELVDMTNLDGYVMYEDDNIIGLITYKIS